MPNKQDGKQLQTKRRNSLPRRWVWPINEIKSYLENKKAEKAIENTTDRYARVAAGATRTMAWLTFFLALVGAGNIWVLEEQLTDARKSSVMQTRAWMVVSDTKFGIAPDTNKTPRAAGIIKIQNTGPTPALHVRVWRCAEVRSDEPNVESSPDSLANCSETEIGIAGNGVPIPMHIYDRSFAVPVGGLSDKHFYYWGRITYNIVPNERSHFTTFCLRDALDQLGPCNNGNNAD